MPIPIRIADDTLPALIVGAILLTLSIVSAWMQMRHYKSLEEIMATDPLTRRHVDRQLRRRLQVSAMLGLVGVMIPVGDQLLMFFKGRPGLFFLYWMTVLGLLFWIGVLALGDWLSSTVYSNLADVQLRSHQRQLEEEVKRFRDEQAGNTSANTHDSNDKQ
ncbi:MAG: hypothetical protein FJ267_12180 [Planctomycetes bacterium]|nr:hypothetical protein [Planctomycetota bacterium]